MSVQHVSLPAASATGPLAKPFQLVCFGLCVAQIVYLAASLIQGTWLVDSSGRGIPTDFVNVWAAGKLALDGHPALAYDWTIHKEIENAAVGYDFKGYYGWHYPPPFLGVASLLALFPYVAAYAGWVAATFSGYIATVRWLIGHRFGYLLAAAFPAALSNAIVGQNGFVTAALIGGALGFMEKQPVIAGCCLGLLTYKPQFGILFPLVLVAAKRWTVFFTAAAAGGAMAFLSWLAYGTETWEAFFHWLPVTSHTFLSEGQADIAKMQSLFALVRMLHGSETLAWTLQAAFAAIIAALLCLVWRGKFAFDLKAAALATGVLLATPYLYLYDLVVLVVPVAFLLRISLASGFLSGESAALAFAAGLIFIFPFVKLPVGFAAILIVAALLARRMFVARNAR